MIYIISYRIAGHQLAIGWLWAGQWLAMGWLWAGYWLPKGSILAGNGLGYGLAMGCLSAIYGLGIGWLWTGWAGYQLAISYLLAGYKLTMVPNQYTSRHSHILCTKVEYGCMQYFSPFPSTVWAHGDFQHIKFLFPLSRPVMPIIKLTWPIVCLLPIQSPIFYSLFRFFYGKVLVT